VPPSGGAPSRVRRPWVWRCRMPGLGFWRRRRSCPSPIRSGASAAVLSPGEVEPGALGRDADGETAAIARHPLGADGVLLRRSSALDLFDPSMLARFGALVGNLATAIRGGLVQARLASSEAVLRQSEHQFRTLADTGTELIRISGLDRRCNYVNQPWLPLTGRRNSVWAGSSWYTRRTRPCASRPAAPPSTVARLSAWSTGCVVPTARTAGSGTTAARAMTTRGASGLHQPVPRSHRAPAGRAKPQPGYGGGTDGPLGVGLCHRSAQLRPRRHAASGAR